MFEGEAMTRVSRHRWQAVEHIVDHRPIEMRRLIDAGAVPRPLTTYRCGPGWRTGQVSSPCHSAQTNNVIGFSSTVTSVSIHRAASAPSIAR